MSREFPLVLETRGEERGRPRRDPPERGLGRHVGEDEFPRRARRLQHVVEPGQLLPAEAEILVPVDIVQEHEAHVVPVEEKIRFAEEGPRDPAAFLPDVVVPVDVEDGVGRVSDDLQISAVVFDHGRDDPVPEVDDERRPRIERGDLVEEGPEGHVAVGDGVPDDDEPQVTASAPGRDLPRGLPVGRDEAPELLGDRGQPGIIPEPGQVISAVFEGVYRQRPVSRARIRAIYIHLFVDNVVFHFQATIIADG